MMPQTPSLRNQSRSLPQRPGVYLFKSAQGKVLYVGKATNLRSRTGQYFGKDSRPQIPFLMEEARELDYTVTSSELEALYLENTLIKQYRPKYNILLRDDKNYAFITIDYSTEIPTIGYARSIEHVTRSTKPIATSYKLPATTYFGPYSSVARIRQVLGALEQVLPICKSTKVGARPCFNLHLHRCSGVCVGKISLAEYTKQLDQVGSILSGQTTVLEKNLTQLMTRAAKSKKFELAARLRDQIHALHVLRQKQTALFPARVSWDFVSTYAAYGDVCVNLFKVREGKLIDKESFIYNGPNLQIVTNQQIPTNNARNNAVETLQQFLESYYQDTSDIPKEIYIEQPVDNPKIVEHLLKSRGRRVALTVPNRGSKRKLLAMGQTNAEEYLRKWQTTQGESLERMQEILAELQQLLRLPTLPRRIECYDISNTQGTNPVGSMVVFEQGLPAKNQYRKFAIRSKSSPDDFAMMKEMFTRRLAHISNTKSQITNNKSNPKSEIKNLKSKWPLPDLMVIDGGKGQLKVAVDALKKSKILNLQSAIPVIGLAKRIEEIFVPGKKQPIVLPHDNPILHILQRLRDEAHRFAITFHKQKRSKQAVRSALDDIPGVGPKTKKLLKQKFGSWAKIKAASLDDLAAVVGPSKARALKLT